VRFKAKINHAYQISFPNNLSPFSSPTITVPAGGVSLPVAVIVDPSVSCPANGTCVYPYDIVDTTADPAHACNNKNPPAIGSDGLVVHGGN
jgi:hypothetical protein